MMSSKLCLACSSSLKVSASLYLTSCCQRPICPSCIDANPRLARYNPCLACLGGVDVVASRSSSAAVSGAKGSLSNPDFNIDGAVRDEDTFILGDDDEDCSDNDDIMGGQEAPDSESILPPPPYDPTSDTTLLDSKARVHTAELESRQGESSHVKSHPTGNIANEPSLSSSLTEDSQKTRTVPYKYYINRNDTLQGLALKFGLDAHEICKLNKLPLQSVRTMPHLLHTRAFLLLPPSTKPHPLLKQDNEDEESKVDIVRKRAEKRLQILTKEVDWRIAKTYVALAEDDLENPDTRKEKAQEKDTGATSSGSAARMLETLAIDSYLDDENWETAERRAGRGVYVPKFPLSPFQAEGSVKGRTSVPSNVLSGDWRWWR